MEYHSISDDDIEIFRIGIKLAFKKFVSLCA